MKLGTSQRGTGVPALVAFMVLATVSVALAGRPEPSGPPEPSPSVAPSSPGRSGHHGETPRATPSPSTAPAAAEACTAALEAGADALEHRHGLERAIEVILGNCEKSPQATGLLTALGRLEANLARREAGHQGGQPNEHANDAATHERGPSAQHGSSDQPHGSSDQPHGSSDHGSAAERDTPASQR